MFEDNSPCTTEDVEVKSLIKICEKYLQNEDSSFWGENVDDAYLNIGENPVDFDNISSKFKEMFEEERLMDMANENSLLSDQQSGDISGLKITSDEKISEESPQPDEEMSEESPQPDEEMSEESPQPDEEMSEKDFGDKRKMSEEESPAFCQNAFDKIFSEIKKNVTKIIEEDDSPDISVIGESTISDISDDDEPSTSFMNQTFPLFGTTISDISDVDDEPSTSFVNNQLPFLIQHPHISEPSTSHL